MKIKGQQSARQANDICFEREASSSSMRKRLSLKDLLRKHGDDERPRGKQNLHLEYPVYQTTEAESFLQTILRKSGGKNLRWNVAIGNAHAPVVVAVDKDRNSKDALKWALSHLALRGSTVYLLHVRPPNRNSVANGHLIPVGQVSKEILISCMPESQSKADGFLREHQRMCKAYNVHADIITVEAESIQKAIVEQISILEISKLVLGTSLRNVFTRKLKGPGIPVYVAQHASSFCTVMVVSRNQLVSLKEASRRPPFSCYRVNTSSTPKSNFIEDTLVDEISLAYMVDHRYHSSPSNLEGYSRLQSPSHSGSDYWSHTLPARLLSHTNLGSIQQSHTLSIESSPSSALNGTPLSDPVLECSSCRLDFSFSVDFRSKEVLGNTVIVDHSEGPDLDKFEAPQCSSPSMDIPKQSNSQISLVTVGEGTSNGGNLQCTSASVGERYVDDKFPAPEEHEKDGKVLLGDRSTALVNIHQLPLKGLQEQEGTGLMGFKSDFRTPFMGSLSGASSPSRLTGEIEPKVLEELESLKLQLEQAQVAVESTRRDAEALARRCKEAEEAAAIAQLKVEQHAAEEEQRRMKEAEERALLETETRKTILMALQQGPVLHYREFEYAELEAATNSFSEAQKIGEGGYGTVYRGKLHHTTVAIKVLNPDGFQGHKEFQREVEVLGTIHHPHMVLLLGCCPEKGCLVYEYMANGSLEDCLANRSQKNLLPWYMRFRIAAEVASALLFLHSSRPEPIVHCDLKPANILLDQNFVSKLGDVGLARLVPERRSGCTADNSVYFRDTIPVGTYAYIDPEYQRTGSFGPKSDVYALGIVILQLLTGTGPVGVFELVEEAVEFGSLKEVLDESAGEWPLEETEEIAYIALRCAEMRRKNRPDLGTEVLPVLDKVRLVAEELGAKVTITFRRAAENGGLIPAIFICPILHEVMEDPVIAADGHTYEFKAIQDWLQEQDRSPLTNLPLASKQLTPNHSLRSAIVEWMHERSGIQLKKIRVRQHSMTRTTLLHAGGA